MYATLESASVSCPKCGAICIGDWQFYFGSVSDLPRYRVGDRISWSGSEWFGRPSMTVVHALAYSVAEPACVSCGVDTILAELPVRAGSIGDLCRGRAEAYALELLYEGESRRAGRRQRNFRQGAVVRRRDRGHRVDGRCVVRQRGHQPGELNEEVLQLGLLRNQARRRGDAGGAFATDGDIELGSMLPLIDQSVGRTGLRASRQG